MSKLTKNQKIAKEKIEAGKSYTLSEAAALVKEVTFTKFDASADIDVRLGVDPFAKLDQKGVGKLMDMSLKLGKPVNPNLHCGICGEHGGDPSSVEFCHNIGLDYVSCSPFRVPVARLAAAQAEINNPRK